MRGSCHCGRTVFEVAHAPPWLAECNCSFCARRGVLWAYYEASEFQLLQGADEQGTYQWNTRLVRHHHCTVCGCSTYSESPTIGPAGPDFSRPRVSVNARLLDLDFSVVPRRAIDGRSFPTVA